MSNIDKILKSPWDLINELADEQTRQEFELDDILVDISSKLINYRINNNLTQKELANRLQISQPMVSKLESGDYNPTIGLLWKVSKKLDWKFGIIFEEEIKKPFWNFGKDNVFYNGETSDSKLTIQLVESA